MGEEIIHLDLSGQSQEQDVHNSMIMVPIPGVVFKDREKLLM